MKNAKKLLTFILAIVVIISTFAYSPMSSFASDGEKRYGDYTYEVMNDGNIRITGYDGTGTKATIPSKINGKKVTRLGEYVSWGYPNVRTCVIPSTVEYVEEDALGFFECRAYYVMNPKCVLEDNALNLFYHGEDEKYCTTIYADDVSYAHNYAKKDSSIGFVIYDTHNNNYEKVLKKATTTQYGKRQVICDYCGKIIKTAEIPSIKKVALKKTSFEYNGKKKSPQISAKNDYGYYISNSYYTVRYINAIDVGTGTAIVTFKGRYSGTVKLNYKINPKGTSLTTVTAKPKSFVVKWNKAKNHCKGYQIRYSTNKSFSNAKTKTISKRSTTALKVNKLKGGKKYYIKVRTYSVVDGKKYYSKWSKYKTVVTKR